MMATQILLQLLLAHILTDFVFQPNAWVLQKREKRAKSFYLYIHSILAGLLTYIILQQWHLWYIALFITLTHFGIDLWKLSSTKDNLRIFLLDQLFHIVIILIAWIYITDSSYEILPFLEKCFSSSAFLAISIGYLIAIFPVGFLIGKATQRWHNELKTGSETGSLEAAGRYIGIFERILVLTFILTNNFSAIGFLIAAKSILRFSDKSEAGARKQTEYVLIGTLMSFAITIIIGLLVRQIAF
ncbi:DUF3307 domain-containing protein [Autumnicola psychrophila]|uniref:DUF3307 domain-containing protein n=1 Tax=Autumnicola psychrophila TaxID=3075592 RepID=A0ABU3DQ08_9FLAO|nr:DUF3307 domain-containing protein [Zunongwangia sp. F225]MDT0685792.1 DUF3307 domain-containing protein [Zunongwangia sp. F225]